MAYPSIASYSSGFTTTNATSTTITAPSGTQAGDTCLLIISKDGSGAFTTPANWELVAGSVDSGNASYFSIFKRTLTGTLSNFSIAHSSEMTAWLCLRFSGEVEITASAVARASSTTPNPPSLASPWSAGTEIKWLACCGWDYNRTCSAYPSNFTSERYTALSTSTSGSGVAMATLNSTTTPQDPSTFTINSTDTWCAFTLAIRNKSQAQQYQKSLTASVEADSNVNCRLDPVIYIERRIGESGSWEEIGETKISPFEDTDIVAGEIYYYRGRIFDGTFGEYSAVVSVAVGEANGELYLQVGDNVFATATEPDTTLTVTGTGAMWENTDHYLFRSPFDELWTFSEDYFEEVIIGEGITTISDGFVPNDSRITSLSLPSTLVSIGECAFQLCPVPTITIPASVEEIGIDAFMNLEDECEIYNLATSPQTLSWPFTTMPQNTLYIYGYAENDTFFEVMNDSGAEIGFSVVSHIWKRASALVEMASVVSHSTQAGLVIQATLSALTSASTGINKIVKKKQTSVAFTSVKLSRASSRTLNSTTKAVGGNGKKSKTIKSSAMTATASLKRGIKRKMASLVAISGKLVRKSRKVANATTKIAGTMSTVKAFVKFVASITNLSSPVGRKTKITKRATASIQSVLAKAFGTSKVLVASYEATASLKRGVKKKISPLVGTTAKLARMTRKVANTTTSIAGYMAKFKKRSKAIATSLLLTATSRRKTLKRTMTNVKLSSNIRRATKKVARATASVFSWLTTGSTEVFEKMLSTAISTIAKADRKIDKNIATMLSILGKIDRKMDKIATVVIGVYGTVKKTTSRAFLTTIATQSNILKGFGRTFTATVTTTAKATRKTARTLKTLASASASRPATLIRKIMAWGVLIEGKVFNSARLIIQKQMATIVTASGTLLKNFIPRVVVEFEKALATSILVATTTRKTARKYIATLVGSQSKLNKAVKSTVTAVLVVASTLHGKFAITKIVTAMVTTSSSMRRGIRKRIAVLVKAIATAPFWKAGSFRKKELEFTVIHDIERRFMVTKHNLEREFEVIHEFEREVEIVKAGVEREFTVVLDMERNLTTINVGGGS